MIHSKIIEILTTKSGELLNIHMSPKGNIHPYENLSPTLIPCQPYRVHSFDFHFDFDFIFMREVNHWFEIIILEDRSITIEDNADDLFKYNEWHTILDNWGIAATKIDIDNEIIKELTSAYKLANYH